MQDPGLKAPRVAMISYRLPAPGQKRGGIERVAHDLADGLARRGLAITVWSHDDKPEGASYAVQPLPWRRFSQSWLGHRLVMGYAGHLLPLCVPRDSWDVLVLHGDSLLAPLHRKPIVRILHGSAREEARHADNLLRRLHQTGVYWGECLSARTTQTVVAISDNTARAQPRCATVIPNGVDRRIFYPDPAARSRQPAILFVGSLRGRKRGALLLDWFVTTIRPRVPEARLWMVTERGPDVPGVEYWTGIDACELAALYRRAWVYASPSSYEGFGLPYLEAMASGTPVIATSNAGSVEVLDNGRAGCLAGDAEFPVRLVALLQREEERAAWAERGHQRASQFDLERTVDLYLDLLRQLTSRERRHA